jgi:hypothetical protein
VIAAYHTQPVQGVGQLVGALVEPCVGGSVSTVNDGWTIGKGAGCLTERMTDVHDSPRAELEASIRSSALRMVSGIGTGRIVTRSTKTWTK